MFSEGDRVRIQQEYKVEYPDPLCVAAGERVMVGREDNEFSGWRWRRAQDGREGWVPIELLSTQGAETIVIENYSARELAVQPGEEVTIQQARHNWLLVSNTQGERGWIPAPQCECG